MSIPSNDEKSVNMKHLAKVRLMHDTAVHKVCEFGSKKVKGSSFFSCVIIFELGLRENGIGGLSEYINN